MAEFPHLKLPFKIQGTTKPKGGGKRNVEAEAKTKENKTNRAQHGEYLSDSANNIRDAWSKLRDQRSESLVLPNQDDIPIFLRVDTEVFDIDNFKLWGIDLVSEEENGYILGASTDNLESFIENVKDFMNEHGIRKDKAAQIWELVTDESWRFRELLKGDLGVIWPEINDDTVYIIELGVSCFTPFKVEYPIAEDFDSVEKFESKVNDFKEKELEWQIARDEKQMSRENEIEGYLKAYDGTLQDIWSNQVDAVFFKVSINGKCLKDIVQTYQYLYEAKLDPTFSISTESIDILDDEFLVDVQGPSDNSPKVCVIDSGIQENHRLIQSAIDAPNSRSYIDADNSTADYVKQSGHGTKVAGAILYPASIPTSGAVPLQTIIQNARILDKDNRISDSRFTPSLIEQIVSDYSPTKIFNLSVSEDTSYSGSHMPSLAASIDKVIHEKGILFIISAGNLKRSSGLAGNIGIAEHLHNGKNYPDYLNIDESKISNPGVSYFALTVGSIAREDFEDADTKALAGRNRVSPFSRVGLGMWGCIKPDIVEFGGDLIKNKLSNDLTTQNSVLPELVNSTMYGSKAVGYDFGTSFSAPKVSHIASRLLSEHPTESSLMYRALIIQSARLPDHCFNNPTLNDFRYYGYGFPDVNRALNNSLSRITFIQDGKVFPKAADIYRIKIPPELRGEGKEFRILAEITLSFTSRTRLTRKGSHSYLANWLEWQSSKHNESFNSFRNRTIELLETGDTAAPVDEGVDVIKWVLRENPAWSTNGINRNNSTIQKSWTFIEPQQFNDEFGIAVIGHVGWDKSLENGIDYALCVSFEAIDTEINLYEVMAQAQIEIEPEQEIEV
ncbi:MAG: S8 family peptidase [Cyclobacteriaceae bacterium]